MKYASHVSCTFLCISLSVEKKFFFNLNQSTKLQKKNMLRIDFLSRDSSHDLKNGTLNLSRNTCTEETRVLKKHVY
jgi:hypothetical protein